MCMIVWRFIWTEHLDSLREGVIRTQLRSQANGTRSIKKKRYVRLQTTGNNLMEAGKVAVLAWGTTFWSEKHRRRAGVEGKFPPRHLSATLYDILPVTEPARWWSLKQYHVRTLDSAFTTRTPFLSYATNPARGDTTAAGRGGVQSILASLYRLVQTASRLHRVGQVTAWRVKVTRSICRADNLSDRLSNSIRKICAKNFARGTSTRPRYTYALLWATYKCRFHVHGQTQIQGCRCKRC